MKRWSVLLLILMGVSACNTYKAAEGKTSTERVMGGVKQDASAVGSTIERGANEIGTAINKALK